MDTLIKVTPEAISDLFLTYEGRPSDEYMTRSVHEILTNPDTNDSEKFNALATKMHFCRGLRDGFTIQFSRLTMLEFGFTLTDEDYNREF